jgi:hypothetical protein
LLGEALARRAGKAWDAADARGAADLRKGNVAVAVASPALIAEIKARTDTLEQAWITKAAAKGVDGTAALRTLREEIAKLKTEVTAAAPAKQ